MRRFGLIILVAFFCAGTGAAQESSAVSVDRFSNVRSSLEDGFYPLAEEQARTLLALESTGEARDELLLLLSRSLWGQKRYEDVLATLAECAADAPMVYWRARALFELKRYEEACDVLADALPLRDEDAAWKASILRLKGRAEEFAGRLAEAAASYEGFAETFPEHGEWVDNQFDLASVYRALGADAPAVSVYEGLLSRDDALVVDRAQLLLGQTLYALGGAENAARAHELLTTLGGNAAALSALRIDAYLELAAADVASAETNLTAAVGVASDVFRRIELQRELVRIYLVGDRFSEALAMLDACRADAPNEALVAELQLQKADVLLLAKRFSDAELAFQVYLDVADDEAGVAHANLGKAVALFEEKRFLEAAALFDKAVELLEGDDKASALIKAGDAYYELQQLDEAEKRYRSFVEAYPENSNQPTALYQWGLVLAKIGRRADALGVFNRVEKQYPSSLYAEKAALQAVVILRANGEWEKALDKYAVIGETYTNAATVALSWHQRGLLLYKYRQAVDLAQSGTTNALAQATAAFETVLSVYPESEYAPQAAYMKGFCLYAEGQVEEAVTICKEFVEKSPNSEWTPDVIFWLAERDFNQGNYTAAEAFFLRIVNDFKAHRLASHALYWAGRAAAATSDFSTATERYARVVNEYPDCDILAQVYFAQGDALSQLGRFEEAIVAFDGLIALAQDHPLVDAAWGRKGDCLFSLADGTAEGYDAAMEAYQAILDRPSASLPLKMQAEYKVGRCLEKLKLSEKAFSRYMNVVYPFVNEAPERTPYAVMWFTRSAFGAAGIRERKQDWAGAVKVYERVVEAKVPAMTEALKRINEIREKHLALFPQSEETDDVGVDG